MDNPNDPAANNQAPEGGKHPLLQKIEADTKVKQGSQAKPEEPNGAPPQTAPDTVEIEIGGTKRMVSKKDLQEAFASKLSIEQREQALQQQLQNVGPDEQLRAFRDDLMKLSPQRQAEVLELIQGKKPAPSSNGKPSADDLMKALGDTGSDDPANATPGIDPKDYSQLRSVVEMLANSHMESKISDRQESAGERVDKLFQEFPVLRENEAARSFAKDHILTQYAQANGQFDLDKAVQQAATRVQKLTDDAQSAQQQQVSLTGGPRLALPSGFKPNAESLQSGAIRQAALDHMRSMQG